MNCRAPGTFSTEQRPWEDGAAWHLRSPGPSYQGGTELAQPGLFESDEEYEVFLADLYASRRAGLA